jgi:hypothetical protein
MTIQAISFARDICKQYGVKLKLTAKTPDRNVAGYIDFDKKIIVICTDGGRKSDTVFLSNVFHELAHLYCAERGWYSFYNTNKEYPNFLYQKYAHRAEILADSVGRKLLDCFLPGVVFCAAYEGNVRETKKFLNKYLEIK